MHPKPKFQKILDLLIKYNNNDHNLHVLISNSKITWPTKILMPFLSFLKNLVQDNHINFEKKVSTILR